MGIKMENLLHWKRWVRDISLLLGAAAVSWWFAGMTAAVCAAAAGTVFLAVGIIDALRQRRKLHQICSDIDCVLHGNYSLSISEYAEGPLSILQNEIHKMTIRLNEQAQALQRDKRYLSDAMADISHQLKTPLTAINLLLTLLSEENLSESRRCELMMRLNASLHHVEWLIATLLKMSKFDADTVHFNKQPVSVAALVEQSQRDIAVAMELNDQHMVIEVDENAAFSGDMAWSVEAVENILKNCMEHLPVGGTITVRAGENALYTWLQIADNGTGFAAEDLPHLFERFYKGKALQKHTEETTSVNHVGIGLALSAMIIQRQNGVITARNQNGGGAEFTIRFYKSVV